MDPNQRIRHLIILHLKGELTIHEQLELQEWVNSSDDHREIFDQLSDPDRLKDELKEYFEAQANIWDKIDAGIKTPAYIEGPAATPAIHPVRRRLRYYIVAASLVGVVVIGYFWLRARHTPIEATPTSAQIATRDVAPGGDKATLTLANDSTIILENAANGSLTTQGSAQVVKDKSSLSYTIAASGQTKAAAAVVYNTLTTPRAGQFQLVLPDGTKVWLNNASSLRYPTSFSGPAREVQLTGEAYFEVAKNSTQPFLVKVPVSDATVHVLGTSFNIMAYTDEPAIRTTLLTGKVSVNTATRQSILSPGEQGVLDQEGIITVTKNIDTDEVIAWQRGFFNFTGASLNDVLRQLARWYDVEVIYATAPPPKYTCDGEIGRNLSLTTILKHLERKDVHFTIEGKRLIVSR